MKKNVVLLLQLTSLFISTPTVFHAQWVQTNGPYGGETTALFAKGDTIIAGIKGGFQLSTDNGEHWSQSDTVHAYIYSLASDGTNVFAATGLGVSRSTNLGMSWSPASNGLSSGVTDFAFLGTKIFAATGNGVFVSSDQGANWSRSDTLRDGPPSYGVSTITVCDTIIVTSCYPGSVPGHMSILRSSDKGKSWSKPDSGFVSDHITALIAEENNVFAATLNNGIYRSSNTSRRWNLVNTGLGDVHVISLITSSTSIFAGTWDGVYLSTNAGAEWNQVDSGLGNTSIRSLAANGKYLYASTESSGVWRRLLSEMITTSIKSEAALPGNFYLFQNYPNPFNPTTIIRYSLPLASIVTLRVYDILGRDIKTLSLERQGEGIHSVSFSADDLSSGIYFYRLSAGNFVSTKKLIVIK